MYMWKTIFENCFSCHFQPPFHLRLGLDQYLLRFLNHPKSCRLFNGGREHLLQYQACTSRTYFLKARTRTLHMKRLFTQTRTTDAILVSSKGLWTTTANRFRVIRSVPFFWSWVTTDVPWKLEKFKLSCSGRIITIENSPSKEGFCSWSSIWRKSRFRWIRSECIPFQLRNNRDRFSVICNGQRMILDC